MRALHHRSNRGAIYPKVLTTHYGGLEMPPWALLGRSDRRQRRRVGSVHCRLSDRSNTAGTMLVRGKGRKVRWFPAGREAAGLLSKRVRPGDIARLTQRMRDSMVRRHQIDRAAARRKGVAT